MNSKNKKYDLVLVLNSKIGETGNHNYEVAILENYFRHDFRDSFSTLVLVRNNEMLIKIRSILKETERSKKRKIDVRIYQKGISSIIFMILNLIQPLRIIISKIHLNKFERKSQGKIYYLLSPNEFALSLSTHNIITTCWDFGHKQLKYIWEISSPYRYFKREIYYRQIFQRSKFIVTDSLNTTAFARQHYKIKAEKIFVLGLPLPKNIETIENKYYSNIIKDSPYLIYPAANWHHKNHIFLIRVFVAFLRQYPNYKLVLCGPRLAKGFSIQNTIKIFDLQNKVVDFGYLKKAEVNYMVKNSKLLIMPTKLGPTNYPVFEAAALGVRSVVSNVHDSEEIKDIRELVKIVPSWQVKDWLNSIDNSISEKRRPGPKRMKSNALKKYFETLDLENS